MLLPQDLINKKVKAVDSYMVKLGGFRYHTKNEVSPGLEYHVKEALDNFTLIVR